eukprot:2772744-Alexandrium_andersonii.AAC.1
MPSTRVPAHVSARGLRSAVDDRALWSTSWQRSGVGDPAWRQRSTWLEKSVRRPVQHVLSSRLFSC